MSQELRDSALQLIKETKLLEIQDKPTIKPIQDVKIDDLSDELKHTQVYHELVEYLDKLMVLENSGAMSYEEVKQELLSSGRISFLSSNGEFRDEEILKYLKQMQKIRRLVIDS